MPIYTLFDNRCKGTMLSSKYVLQHVLLTEYLTLNRYLSFPENTPASFPENTPAFHQFTPAFDKNTPAFSEKTGCLKTKVRGMSKYKE